MASSARTEAVILVNSQTHRGNRSHQFRDIAGFTAYLTHALASSTIPDSSSVSIW